MKTSLDVWSEGYLSFLLKVQKKAPRTIVDIRCTLNRVTKILSRFYPDEPLWQLSLNQFLRWMEFEREQGRTTRTLAKDLSHLRGLLNFAWRSGKCDKNVLDGFNLIESMPQPGAPNVLEVAEAKALIDSCSRKTSVDRQKRLIILLLYGCGLRTSELRFLDIGDIDLERQELFVRFGKGLRERRIPVPDGVWSELLAYMTGRSAKRGPLFRTERHRARISLSHICLIVREAGIKANISQPLFPRTLRHTFATHLMDRGVDMGIISMLMGHRSPKETGVYLHVLKGKREEAVSRLSLETEAEQ